MGVMGGYGGSRSSLNPPQATAAWLSLKNKLDFSIIHSKLVSCLKYGHLNGNAKETDRYHILFTDFFIFKW